MGGIDIPKLRTFVARYEYLSLGGISICNSESLANFNSFGDAITALKTALR